MIKIIEAATSKLRKEPKNGDGVLTIKIIEGATFSREK